MRHKIVGRRLSRSPSHRQALLRHLAQSLIEHGQIRTTLPKAKELVKFVEPLITLAKKGVANSEKMLHARRLVVARLHDRLMADPRDTDVLLDDTVIQKLFKEVAPKMADRNGGYTRIVKTAQWRIGDGGDIAIVQLIGFEKNAEAEAAA
jgi:large subunit ribosomal protein L17